MSNDIFGYSWEDIQRAQQGGRLQSSIHRAPGAARITEADTALMAEHGSIEALEAAGFFGTADRFKRLQPK